ncbi:phosphatase [Pseudoflavonifractor sp. 524-17]|uniref:phosphatase n=1 Tax=Pseudoflavonifractor sp. 524-17 TaxID=2304577 RepID=UPI00137A745B|nr:phosphatase [Pseudoflavonifractor sp. 524-17]NCE64027.1 phosphatase [Pseudoflavonifractor sp. 524-17]
MKFRLDSHSHTVASGHAYSTVLEMAKAAADRGLELLCVTDHAPGMAHTTCRDYFMNLRVIDRTLFGIDVMLGAELNLMDTGGALDLDGPALKELDLAIASLHPKCIPPNGDADGYTNAVLRAMENPYVAIIGHPDDGRYPLDYPAVVRAAGEHGVLLEVNNSSLAPRSFRLDAHVHCAEMLRLCRREGVCVTVGSDAHFTSAVGGHAYAHALLRELGFPPELVINRDPGAFRAMIARRRERIPH